MPLSFLISRQNNGYPIIKNIYNLKEKILWNKNTFTTLSSKAKDKQNS